MSLPGMKRLRDEPDVVLAVGPAAEKILAFSQVLALSSDFFNALFSSDWAEAQSKSVSLPAEDPELIRRCLSIISPATQDHVSEANVLELLPVFHRLQMMTLLAKADEILARASRSHSFTKLNPLPTLLTAAVDFSLATTTEVACKQIQGSLVTHLPALKPLACDDKYAAVMQELWPDIRSLVLSPAQQDAGEMSSKPSPEICECVWGTFTLSATRLAALQYLPHFCFQNLPGGHLTVDADDSDEDEGEGEEYTDIDVGTRLKMKTLLAELFPGSGAVAKPLEEKPLAPSWEKPLAHP